LVQTSASNRDRFVAEVDVLSGLLREQCMDAGRARLRDRITDDRVAVGWGRVHRAAPLLERATVARASRLPTARVAPRRSVAASPRAIDFHSLDPILAANK